MKDKLIIIAKDLRKSMTFAERSLWKKLRNNQWGVNFRKQQLIEKHIVDFVCFEKRLVIEIDGGQHNNNKKDLVRDEGLKKNKFAVLRFWNNEILENIDGALSVIRKNITLPLIPTPTGTPIIITGHVLMLPSREGE